MKNSKISFLSDDGGWRDRHTRFDTEPKKSVGGRKPGSGVIKTDDPLLLERLHLLASGASPSRWDAAEKVMSAHTFSDGVIATDAFEEAPELTVIEDKAATNQFGHELQGHNEAAVSMPAEPNSQKRQKRQTLEAAIKAEVEIKYPRGIPSYVTASEVKRTIGIPAHINTYRRAIGRKK